MAKHIHWLCAGPTSNDLEPLKKSNMASARLRTAIACQTMMDKGYEVTTGDSIFPYSNIVIIGKIGPVAQRFDYWIDQIIKFKANGARILLDYTDNHLGFDSDKKKFYEQFLKVSDHVVVPSNKMKKNLELYWKGPTSIVSDYVEVALQPIKDKISLVPRLFWFGHDSNIEYIIKYIHKKKLLNNLRVHLTIMSNLNGIQVFNRFFGAGSELKNIDLLVWNRDLMIEVAANSDISLIPSSQNDPKKSGVSSNRLLTSLALGLPILATKMPSYEEFDKYFLDIDNYSIEYMINNINEQKKLVANAQLEILSEYGKDEIGEKWSNLLASL